MLLFYLDESGTGLRDERTPFFVLATVAIRASEWLLLDDQVSALKRKLVPYAKPEDFEIKGRDIRQGLKFFKGRDLDTRLVVINDVAQLIANLPCRIFAVVVDKRDLPEYIGSDNDLYRLALWRLLDLLEAELNLIGELGMLMVDNRSDMHSSIQDRRIVDAYREWMASRQDITHLTELPWFGFSAFYTGLQLADFAAYTIDHVENERGIHEQKKETTVRERDYLPGRAFDSFSFKVQLVRIP